MYDDPKHPEALCMAVISCSRPYVLQLCADYDSQFLHLFRQIRTRIFVEDSSSGYGVGRVFISISILLNSHQHNISSIVFRMGKPVMSSHTMFLSDLSQCLSAKLDLDRHFEDKFEFSADGENEITITFENCIYGVANTPPNQDILKAIMRGRTQRGNVRLPPHKSNTPGASPADAPGALLMAL